MRLTRKPRMLVTAGPTREYLDPVRYVSNDSSGRMGFAIATAARARGWRVTLVHGPVELPRPARVRAFGVTSAIEMLATCSELWPRHDVLVMAAAVADYAPVRAAGQKRKKTPKELTLRLKPTADVLAALSAQRRPGQLTIGFALEDRSERQNAERKLRSKNLDAIVLNRPDAIGATRSTIELLVRGEDWWTLPTGTKTRHAAHIVRVAEQMWRNRLE